MQYTYSAADYAGKITHGTEDAADEAGLVRALAGRGLYLIESSKSPALAMRRAQPRTAGRKAVLIFTRGLASLLGAGVTLGKSLAASEHFSPPEIIPCLRSIHSLIDKGSSLADAMREWPTVFPPVYVGMVRASEQSGRLPEGFARLTRHLEREEEVRARLLSAAFYPILLATFGTITIMVLVFLVLPRFMTLLEETGAVLPWTTKLLLSIGGASHRTLPLLLLVGVSATGVVIATRMSKSGRMAAARALLKLPVVGEARRRVLAARFARLMAVLLGGGAPILSALRSTSDSLTDPLVVGEVDRVSTMVREGATLHEALGSGRLFPPLLIQLAGIGEEAGRLEEFLDKTADIFDQEVERALHRLATLAEPVLIILLGGIIGFVALSLLQAIYGVNAGTFQ